MPKYYSPKGNFEVWAEKPDGYYTETEWRELHPIKIATRTKAEMLADLDAQYEADKAELLSAFTDALLNGDTEGQQSCQDDMAALNEQYDSDYNAILEGVENGSDN